MSIKEGIDKTIDLYSNAGWKKWFAHIRFWDAPYVEVEKMVPKSGVVVELGCGEGLFSNFLAVSSGKRKVYGFDIDEKRIKDANRGVKNSFFKKADATKLKLPKRDVILMFHLLHHLTSKDLQVKFTKNVFKSMKKGERLIIVEIDKKPFLKYLTTYFVDHLLVAWLFERKIFEPLIFFREKREWKSILEEIGFECSIKSASRGKPFSHIILDCTKTRNI